MEDLVNKLATGENVAFTNPRLEESSSEVTRAAEAAGLAGHCIFRTSGSTGNPKHVCLSLDALMASAWAVNAFLDVFDRDRWMNALPPFHVGGFGVELRAHLSGTPCSMFDGKWDVEEFVARCAEEEATLTALVPTQLSDIARDSHRCPEPLRVVLAGGGAMSEAMREKLRGLGWPIRATYGMTETGSQIATENEDGAMNVLPIWETRNARDGRLAVRGDALLSGYLLEEDGAFCFSDPRDENGWFVTSDRVRFERGRMHFLGRADWKVKVMGELVDLVALEELLGRLSGGGRDVAVCALPEERKGCRMVGFVEGGAEGEVSLLRRFNEEVAGFERLEEVITVNEFPRTALGKIDRSKLTLLATGDR